MVGVYAELCLPYGALCSVTTTRDISDIGTRLANIDMGRFTVVTDAGEMFKVDTK